MVSQSKLKGQLQRLLKRMSTPRWSSLYQASKRILKEVSHRILKLGQMVRELVELSPLQCLLMHPSSVAALLEDQPWPQLLSEMRTTFPRSNQVARGWLCAVMSQVSHQSWGPNNYLMREQNWMSSKNQWDLSSHSVSNRQRKQRKLLSHKRRRSQADTCKKS